MTPLPPTGTEWQAVIADRAFDTYAQTAGYSLYSTAAVPPSTDPGPYLHTWMTAHPKGPQYPSNICYCSMFDKDGSRVAASATARPV